MKDCIENGSKTSNGVFDEILKSTLNEAYQKGIEVYALFVDDSIEFREKYMEKYPHEFRNVCGNEYMYFDDVAVNNESFTKVKNCYSEPDKLAQLHFMTDLNTAVTNAAPLPFQLSISWNWYCRNNGGCGYSYVPRYLNWNGNMKKVLEHMVHISDSVDVA